MRVPLKDQRSLGQPPAHEDESDPSDRLFKGLKLELRLELITASKDSKRTISTRAQNQNQWTFDSW